VYQEKRIDYYRTHGCLFPFEFASQTQESHQGDVHRLGHVPGTVGCGVYRLVKALGPGEDYQRVQGELDPKRDSDPGPPVVENQTEKEQRIA
jgi:hypothetical protein